MNKKIAKNGIVIPTHPTSKLFLKDCLESLKGIDLPILLVGNDNYNVDEFISEYGTFGLDIRLTTIDFNGFELGGIFAGHQVFENFFLLPDSCVLKKPKELMDIVFGYHGGVSMCENYMSFIGKYRSIILDRVGTPKVHDKYSACLMEIYFNQTYLKFDAGARACVDTSAKPLAVESKVFEEKHGSHRMVLENEWIVKYKGTWDLNMIPKIAQS